MTIDIKIENINQNNVKTDNFEFTKESLNLRKEQNSIIYLLKTFYEENKNSNGKTNLHNYLPFQGKRNTSNKDQNSLNFDDLKSFVNLNKITNKPQNKSRNNDFIGNINNANKSPSHFNKKSDSQPRSPTFSRLNTGKRQNK